MSLKWQDRIFYLQGDTETEICCNDYIEIETDNGLLIKGKLQSIDTFECGELAINTGNDLIIIDIDSIKTIYSVIKGDRIWH